MNNNSQGKNFDYNCDYPQSISAAEFWQASSEMGCSDVWDLIVSAGCISTFTDMKSLKSAFISIAARMIAYQQSNGSLEPLSSVFLFGHGDSERVKVGFGEKFDSNGKTLKRPAMLSVSDVSELLDTCQTDVAHIMTCKASRFTRNLLDKTKALSGRNDRVLFLAYGAEDITTVPLVFAPGTHQCVSLLQWPWQRTETESCHYVHCNAGVKAYVAYATHDHKTTIADVCKSVMLCSHQGKNVQLCPIDIFTRNDELEKGPRKHLARQLSQLYPRFSEMSEFAAKYTTIGKYNQDLVDLTDRKMILKYLS